MIGRYQINNTRTRLQVWKTLQDETKKFTYMKYVVGILLAGLLSFSACSEDDPSDSGACKKATEEWKDAQEALQVFTNIGPPDTCSPVCSEAHKTWLKERARLVRIESDKEYAKVYACQ